MTRTLPYIVLSLLVYGILFYLQNYQPAVLTDVLIKVDVFGFTTIAEEEQARRLKIKNLTIPYEQKQVLINRTVFIDADTEMVRLALGEPNEACGPQGNLPRCMASTPSNEIDQDAIYYEYFLANDKRPTVLVFKDDKLIKAYKGSAIEPVAPHP